MLTWAAEEQMQGMRRLLSMLAWVAEAHMQGMQRLHNMPAWVAEEQVQGLWRLLSMLTWVAKEHVQGMQSLSASGNTSDAASPLHHHNSSASHSVSGSTRSLKKPSEAFRASV